MFSLNIEPGFILRKSTFVLSTNVLYFVLFFLSRQCILACFDHRNTGNSCREPSYHLSNVFHHKLMLGFWVLPADKGGAHIKPCPRPDLHTGGELGSHVLMSGRHSRLP
jgi:hypothetical protein